MWGAIIGVVFQLIGMWINKSKMSNATKQQYFEWVKQAAGDLTSVKLHTYAEKQIAELKKKPFVPT